VTNPQNVTFFVAYLHPTAIYYLALHPLDSSGKNPRVTAGNRNRLTLFQKYASGNFQSNAF
jgi:hypothetical protein